LKNLNSLDAKIDFTTGDSMGEIVTLNFPVRKDIDMQGNTNGMAPSGLGEEKKMYVLIVEDEKINANIFKMYIESMVNVSTAFSGNEAMNIIEISYNKGILFNMVFMDIGLPEPWDGILLKQAIEKKWPEYSTIPFIAQTAYSGKNIAERIGSANFKGYLIKPINRNDVLRFLSKYSRK
jgi:CheY-like chemotaxis protein